MATRVRARRARHNAGPPRWKVHLLDAGIVLATGVVCLFVFSFSTRLSYSGPDEREPPIIVHVQILNGCGRPGLAKRVAEYMSDLEVGRMRFDVVDIGNFDRTSVRRTFIINRSLPAGQVREIVAALALGGADIQDGTTRMNDLGVDLTLILGSGTIEPPEEPLASDAS